MIVSLVDLRYVFGRSVLVRLTFHPWSVSWGPMLWSRVCLVDPRCGLQQHYNNMSVFMLVWHVFMSSLLNHHPAQHHLSRVRPIPLRDFPLERKYFLGGKIGAYYAEIGRNAVCKHQIQPKHQDEQAGKGWNCRTRLARPNYQARTGIGNYSFPCSADHEQDWQPYPVDPYFCICDDHTYICCYSMTVPRAYQSLHGWLLLRILTLR